MEKLKLTSEDLEKAPAESGKKSILNDEFLGMMLNAYPKNKSVTEVAAKILLIDVTYSTGLRFRFNESFTIGNFAEGIVAIPDLDSLIEGGNPEAVDKILEIPKEVNLFSFASKYCFAHNYFLYGKDDFSIYDSAVEEYLPKCADCTRTQLEQWRKDKNYSAFNSFVGEYLSRLHITTDKMRYKFDRFLWNKKRVNKK